MKHRDFNDNDIFYASWTDAIQEFVSTLTSNIRLTVQSNTSIRMTAGAGSLQASAGIEGVWRYRTTNFDLTISGGSGVKDIFAVASTANDFVGVGSDPDETDYTLGLAFTATGGTPGGVHAYRKIAEVDWDGSKITGLRQFVGADSTTMPLEPTAPNPNVSPVKIKGAASQSADLFAVHKSDGTKVFAVDPSGALTFVTGQIETADLADQAVTSGKIADGTIVNDDISPSAAIAESKLNLASDAAAGTPSRRTLGTGATQAAAGNDSRLSDARTPLAHTQAASTITDFATASRDQSKAGTGLVRSTDTLSADFGTGAGKVTEGNDSRLSNSRTPSGAAGGVLSGTYPNPGINLTFGSTASTGTFVFPSSETTMFSTATLDAGTYFVVLAGSVMVTKNQTFTLRLKAGGFTLNSAQISADSTGADVNIPVVLSWVGTIGSAPFDVTGQLSAGVGQFITGTKLNWVKIG